MSHGILKKFMLLGLCGCALATGAVALLARPSGEGGFHLARDVQEIEGVWRSRGYGWLLEIRDGDVSFYDESASLCIEDESASSNLQDMSDNFQVSKDGRTIRLPLEEIAYQYTFDRIDALPQRCETAPDAGPRSVIDAVIDLFSRHYAFFGARNIDWPTLASEARNKVTANTTSDQLLDVVGGLVSQIDDAHVSLEARKDGATVWREASPRTGVLHALADEAKRRNMSVDAMTRHWEDSYWESDIESAILGGDGRQAGNGNIRYGMIGDDVGYIAIKAMEGLTRRDSEDRDIAALNSAMDKAMQQFSNARAVIVDVSINEGGYDTVALALAGRFAAERTLGYYKHAGDTEKDRPQPIYIEPVRGKRFTGPVYVMTSDATISAAEIFVLAMRALPNVIHVGTPTRGSLSDILAKPLPNGWSINLSNEIYLDVQGRAWESKGIPPDVAMEIFSRDNVMNGHVEAVRAVVGMTRNRGGAVQARR